MDWSWEGMVRNLGAVLPGLKRGWGVAFSIQHSAFSIEKCEATLDAVAPQL
jgi:hypothetical protein